MNEEKKPTLTPEVKKFYSDCGKYGAAFRMEKTTAQKRKEVAAMGGKAKAERFKAMKAQEIKEVDVDGTTE